MTLPRRIQLSRKRGSKLPPDTIVVARPSRWGNPFKVGVDGDAAECVRKYRDLLFPYSHQGNSSMEAFYLSEANLTEIRATLWRKNLACWCALDAPCHADVLLDAANGGPL